MKPLVCAAALALLVTAACTKTELATGPQGMAAITSSTVVAVVGGKQITLGEVDNSVAKELYQLRHQALETMIVRNLVLAEAAKAGKNEDDFLAAKVNELAPPPSDQEIKEIYEANKEAFGDKTLEQLKPMISARMRQDKEKDAMLAWFDSLKKQAGVKVMLPEPRSTVAAVGPAKGPEGAPVTIVEFSDFQCPFCAQARKTAEQTLTAYAGKVRLVFRNFPLSFHDKAQKAAEAAQCANEQGKFWELHDWMFDHQDKLDPASLKEAAKTLGIDAGKFDTCLDSGKMAAKIAEDQKAGEAAGVSGTPAFFVNGRLISGNQPFDTFKQMVDDELAAK